MGCGDGGRICPLSFGLMRSAQPYIHTYIRSQRNIRPGRFSLTDSPLALPTLSYFVPSFLNFIRRLIGCYPSQLPPSPNPSPPPPPHSSSSSVRPSSRCRLEFRTFGLSFPPVLFSDLPVVIPPSTRSGNGESEKARVVDWRIEVRRPQQFRLSISSHHAPASPVPSPVSTT